jgi:flagellin-like protein
MMIIKNMSRKGISPLIASVVLIAVTMAIAGFLSVWAMQTFSTQQQRASLQSECIGSLQIIDPIYNTQTNKVIFTLRNTNSKLTFSQSLVAFLVYEGGSREQFDLRQSPYSVPNPLTTTPVNVILSPATVGRPITLRITSNDCKEYIPEANIP